MTPQAAHRLAILGAAGDLADRLLMPALARLGARDLLPRGVRVVAIDRAALDDAGLRERIGRALAERAGDSPLREYVAGAALPEPAERTLLA